MNRTSDNKQHFQRFSSSRPEPGQLVEVRRRQWVVSDVQGQSFEFNGEQHLVTLSSLDEDALGEEIQVIWQIEPGAKVLENAGMPQVTGVDSEDKAEAFLDAVRWGAVTNVDKWFLQAPFRSGINIEDYQLDPVVRAIDMTRVNLLIADDVGLGKTIEAGLVIQELLIRHRARSVFVVCPASLQIKWKIEMWEKFGLEFRIIDSEYVRLLRRERGIHANPWTSYPRLITSMDWMKSGEGLRLIKDCLPPTITYPRKFDILIIDEAHNVAPSTASKYALESQRTKLIRTIAPHFEHKLFLSATPHNGYQESFTSLLELLDDQRFARSVMPDERQLQRVMVRRLKTDLVNADGTPAYSKRKLLPLNIEYSKEEREIHNLLKRFTKSRSQSVKGSAFEYGSEFVHKLLKKRLFSSPMAFAGTLAKHRESLERPRLKRKTNGLDDKILKKAILKTEEEFADDQTYELTQEEAVEIAGELSVPINEEQKEILDKLTNWAEKFKNRVDSKAEAIIAWIDKYLKKDGDWNEKRVILFTEFRATHVWMEQILTSYGFGGDRLMLLHGSIDQDDREKIKAAFQTDPNISPVRILLATDAASEGIDLQNFCNYMIHIEIPWNPNVMEQRNGRIDRHGQKAPEVLIWHPVGKRLESDNLNYSKAMGEIEGDHEYLMRAVIKIDSIREDLGTVGPVIAQQIEEAMLGKRTNLDTLEAERKAAMAKKYVMTEKKLKEKIKKLHEKLVESQTDFHLSAENIHRTVSVALELAEKPPLNTVSLPDAPDGSVFEVPIFIGTWGNATAGLEHPHTGKRRPITFDHEVAKGRDDVVLAHLNHPLVKMCLRLLREELWKLDDLKKLHRVSIKFVPNDKLTEPSVLVWSRLVITGGDYNRLHEEITISGGELKETGFSRIPQQGRLNELLEGAVTFHPKDVLMDKLTKLFENEESAVRAAIEARSKDRLRYLENTVTSRKESEIKDLMNILDELEKTINNELREDALPKQITLPGFEPEERNQISKDIETLRLRLARIPEERKLEKSVIEKRYERLTARTFPVAIVFLVPESLKESI
ncbi:DISARM system SNF2-like helicase DrmD [Legionella pneumophila serogroup 1]|uniref:DISARM system SNF2-like helicase DrmD n=1 Tax=Legionella pneumophila TaxID=446 RepID=UPI0007708F92|nr:DISARM system SNF2-like helicase DrmD [Legionella pneumophila]TIG87089.1 helicase [Legionella pneumophila]CZH02456.1 RNA polymerase-associated protein rapA [Legionella pneumophila]STX81882.1 RNA polymerase-associated protein HepA [Legionella pneumophila]HAT8774200.1 helicase [Legionella pneumophila]HAU0824518.1 DEAD/DEAH box helicase [Legionella pneumophila]